jgi:hypothetical protein
MSETANRSGVQLSAPGGRDSVVAFPDELFSHLHFDRRARAWRAPDEIGPEAMETDAQDGALQLRCA